MSDEANWWLLECGHYGHTSDETTSASPTLRCGVCRSVEKFSGHSYRDQPDRRKVKPA